MMQSTESKINTKRDLRDIAHVLIKIKPWEAKPATTWDKDEFCGHISQM